MQCSPSRGSPPWSWTQAHARPVEKRAAQYDGSEHFQNIMEGPLLPRGRVRKEKALPRGSGLVLLPARFSPLSCLLHSTPASCPTFIFAVLIPGCTEHSRYTRRPVGFQLSTNKQTKTHDQGPPVSDERHSPWQWPNTDTFLYPHQSRLLPEGRAALGRAEAG